MNRWAIVLGVVIYAFFFIGVWVRHSFGAALITEAILLCPTAIYLLWRSHHNNNQ